MQFPAAHELILTATNATFRQLETLAPTHTMLFRVNVSLSTTMALSITIRNYGQKPVSGMFDASVGTDFRDMFDIRGMAPEKRPEVQPPAIGHDEVTLAATSADGARISTRITAAHAQETHSLTDMAYGGGVLLRHPVDLAPGEQTVIAIDIAPEPVGEPLQAVESHEQGEGFVQRLDLASPSARFNAFLRRCDADLALLQTTFPDGNIPAAGIPWFIAPFGRDSLIVALQTLPFYPKRSASTLRLLATLQGKKVDLFREEEPGKVLHEMRYGDMARTGQVPHTPYYGSIDSTPLFVMTFARHYRWHRDDALYDDVIDNVRRALVWMETLGDLDGDGLLEFRGTQLDSTHIAQQGWKDSGDSLNYADGRPVTGPIALVEVQGYAYAAYAWLAEAARLRGDVAWARELRDKAEVIREKVESAFWMEDQQFYAQALDGAKQPVDAISSNPGHLLYCGLPSEDRAAAIAKRFREPDMNAGWGIRTLSTDMATYNPMSYHNGSIWPHDTSLAMAGLRAYGHIDLARSLAMSIEKLASGDQRFRIAELYCGFANEDNGLGPVNYPVSCIPQAWAAGSGLLALTTLLGIDMDTRTQTVTVSPHLPEEWTYLDVDGIRAGERTFNVRARRVDSTWAIAITESVAS
jgi:glycogen debranching enzyme